jgi:hypothetical protein
MSDQPWGVDANNPLNEGSEPTAVPYDPDQEHEPEAGEQGGQPNLSPDPAVSGRPSRFGQGSTDDSPGTPSGL